MNRPRIVIHNAASADGRLTVAPEALLLLRDERWKTIQEWGGVESSGGVYERLKREHKPGAILEGSGSFVREGDAPEPLPPVDGDAPTLHADFMPDAVVNRPDHRGWFTVVDGRGRARWLYKEFPDPAWEGWHLLILAGRHTPPEYLAYLRRENIPYLVAGEKRVDLQQAMEKLKTQLGVACVVSTAGGKLNGALVRAGLADEVSIELLPAVVGGLKTPSLFDAPDLLPGEWPTRLKLISAQVHAEGRVWLRYEVVKKDGTRINTDLH